jgi:hypothetical protein
MCSDLLGNGVEVEIMWNAADTGRFVHSKFPKVSLQPWFKDQREDRKLVSTVSRIMVIWDY